MPRYSIRLLGSALLALVLLLFSGQATAGPDQQDSVASPAERQEPAPSFLLKFRDFLSALWAENGSILDPNGGDAGTSSGGVAGDKPGNSGDNGSILDPDGRP